MFARIHGIDLSYELHGEGEPILLVHGFPLSGRMWHPLIPLLKDRHRLIIPDLRGHGASGVSDATTMPQFADDLAGLLDALRVSRPVTFVGLSMGGYIGLEFLRRHAGRVRALVLADTHAMPDTPQKAAERAASAQQVLAQGSRTIADGMIEKLFAPGAPQALKDEWLQIMAATSPLGVAAALKAMAARPDSIPTLREARVPCLIVVGAQDILTPPNLSQAMHEAAAGSQLVIIPDAGHMAPLEQPAAFAQALESFLARLPG